MAGTHQMHRTNYGPESGLDAKARVFLMIQHHLVGNWQIRLAIPKSVIQRETGVPLSTLDRVIKQLERSKMLLVERRQIGGVWQENIYQLHPVRFSSNPLYQGDGVQKPTFQVLKGGKFVDKNGGGNSKTEGTPPVKSEGTPPPNNEGTKNPETHAQSGSQPPVRILQESFKNNTRGVVDEKGKELPWSDVREELLEKWPHDLNRLKAAYGHLSTTKRFNGTPVAYPANFILKCWDKIRDQFASSDYAVVPPPKQEDPAFQYASEEVKTSVANYFRNSLKAMPQ